MNDLDKRPFWAMMNIAMDLTNRPALTKESVTTYFNILAKYEFSVVRTAVDKWLESSTKPPSPKDILELCKPITPIYNAIERKVDKEKNIAFAKNVVEFVAENSQDKTDYLRWAKNMDKNPEKYRSDHVAEARAILRSRGVALA